MKLLWVFFAIFGPIILLTIVGFFSTTTQEITWNDFEAKILNKNAVEKIVVVNKQTARVYIKEEFKNDPEFREVMKVPFGQDRVNPGPHYSLELGSVDSFERKIQEAQKEVAVSEQIVVSYEESAPWKEIL